MADASRRTRDVAVVGRGIQPTHVRQTNQRAILSVISLQPGISNAELARLTDLAPQTVSSVVSDLEARRLITRGAVVRGKRGQPATPLYMNPDGAFCIGAEIGCDHVEVALVSIGTKTHARRRVALEAPDPDLALSALASATRELTDRLAPTERDCLTGLALAAPTAIADPPADLVPDAAMRQRWARLDVIARAAEMTGLETSLVVDGHAACWAERVAHPAPRPLSFLFLLLDTCISGGIIAENKLWEGINGGAGSLGDMLVSVPGGALQPLHQTASLKALSSRLAAAGLSMPAPGQMEALQAAHIDAWSQQASADLAQAILNATRVMEFETAVLETALPPAATARLVELVRARLAILAPPGVVVPPLVAGHLGRSGAAEGAALLRMYRLFFSRELTHLAP